MLSTLFAITLSEFAKNYLPFIIVGVMVIVFIIIVAVAIGKKKKNSAAKYVPDEIDKSVDEAARKKSEEKALEATEAKEEPKAAEKQEVPYEFRAVKVDHPKTTVKKDAKAESKPAASSANEQPKTVEKKTVKVSEISQDDEDEEITFEADDVDQKQEQKDAPKRKISYRILYDKETKTWEVRKDEAKRVIRRVKTKKEALEIAQELSQKQDLNLVVHKKDGKFQKKR